MTPRLLRWSLGWRQVFFVVQFMGETEQTQANKEAFVQAAETDIGAVFASSPTLQSYGTISSEVQQQSTHPIARPLPVPPDALVRL